VSLAETIKVIYSRLVCSPLIHFPFVRKLNCEIMELLVIASTAPDYSVTFTPNKSTPRNKSYYKSALEWYD